MTTTLEKFERPVVASSSLGALPAVQAFRCRNGEAHLLFACHAALPLGLTPELLYSLWANFQTDCQSKSLDIPWVATADLLLSNLCEEVGAGLYEMLPDVRAALVDLLERDSRFEMKRIREIAAFLATYIQPQLNSENLDIRDFAQAQNWLSTAYLRPEKAAQELSAILANAFQKKSDDLLRVASIVSALEKPLADYPDLLAYARGMANYAQGDIEAAQKAFDQLRASAQSYDFSSEGIPLPSSTQQKTEVEQKQTSRKLPVAFQIMVSLAVGSAASGGVWEMRSPMSDLVLVDSVHPSLPSKVYVSEIPRDELRLDKENGYVAKSTIETKQKPLPKVDFVGLPEYVPPSDNVEKPGVTNDGPFLENDSGIVIDAPEVDAANTPLPVGNPSDNLPTHSVSDPSENQRVGSNDVCSQCQSELPGEGSSRESPFVNGTITDGESNNGANSQSFSTQENDSQSNAPSVASENRQVRDASNNRFGQLLSRSLTRGNEGADVRVLQRYLSYTGLLTNVIDGVYGQDTADAVANYQRIRELSVTGIANEETLRDMGFGPVETSESRLNLNNTNNGVNLYRTVLTRGDEGADVRTLQRYLSRNGLFTTVIDGLYGQEVADAVATYQRIRELPVTGIANKETLLDMNFDLIIDSSVPVAATPTPVVSESRYPDATGADIIALQQRLNDFGIPVSVNGIYDFETQQAVRTYQRVQDLNVTGNADLATLENIGLDSNSPDSRYVAVIIADEETLSEIQAYFPDAFIDRHRLGSFINIGNFAERFPAEARVDAAANRGFTSRVLYRREGLFDVPQ